MILQQGQAIPKKGENYVYSYNITTVGEMIEKVYYL